MLPLEQQRAPEAETRQRDRQNVYYPQARVTLSVVFENFGDPKNPRVFPVSPRNITIFSNSYKEADTWSLTFDAAELPVTPELIRAGSCEIYLFQTPGIGQPPEVVRAPRPGESSSGLEPSIVGLFDEGSLEMSSSGRSVTIDGTDYTSLFIAKQWHPKLSGKGGRSPAGRLDLVLKTLMAQVPSASNMSLAVEPKGARLPIVGQHEGKTNKKGIPVGGGNYWDVMYDLAVRHGFILYVRGLKVVLVELESFIKEKKENVRKMAWGRNITSLRMSRRMGKEQVPIIECQSYDDKHRVPIKARFPVSKEQLNRTRVTGYNTKNDEVKVIRMPGVRSKVQLQDIARQIYYSLARAEQRIEIATMDLRDLEGRDLIELRTGDAMSIGFDSFNSDSVILEGMNDAQRTQTLKNLGYDPAVASEISRTFDSINLFKRPLRVREATIEWDHESGLSISAELQNFVNIKGQAP